MIKLHKAIPAANASGYLYMNIDHIVALQKQNNAAGKDFTAVIFGLGIPAFDARETPEEIMELITEARISRAKTPFPFLTKVIQGKTVGEGLKRQEPEARDDHR